MQNTSQGQRPEFKRREFMIDARKELSCCDHDGCECGDEDSDNHDDGDAFLCESCGPDTDLKHFEYRIA